MKKLKKKSTKKREGSFSDSEKATLLNEKLSEVHSAVDDGEATPAFPPPPYEAPPGKPEEEGEEVAEEETCVDEKAAVEDDPVWFVHFFVW